MGKYITSLIEDNQKDFFRYMNLVASSEQKLMVYGNLQEILNEFIKKSEKKSDYKPIGEVIRKVTESVTLGSSIYFGIRESVGRLDFYKVNVEEKYLEEIEVNEFFRAKESYVSPEKTDDILSLNFNTFYDKFPSIREAKSIGRGVEYLNRYLSSTMFTHPEKMRKALFDFLFIHKHNSHQLVLNDRVKDTEDLSRRIDRAINFLKKRPDDEEFENLKNDLQDMGFEKGLGNTAESIIENLRQLDDLLQTPDFFALKKFISNIPMIFNIAIVSPHGYFGQEGVLGMPDTGGQVVYILDQVKALEKAMNESLIAAGVDAAPKIIILTRLIPNAGITKSNQRLEKVNDTLNSWILRVPFRSNNPAVTDNWISRFEVWPYLENFAEDSYKELLTEFGTRPDLIIGNYSDGNIVAFLLSKKYGVTQCNIAHALEKSKYLYSALYWKNLEEQYHFSAQFTADLIAMNSANIIITSSYQEIAGTDDSIGQYESYYNFTMPDLYRVTGGINLFHPKFNIVPPGVNFNYYFPYTKEDDRLPEIKEELNCLLFENADNPDVVGKLENPDLIPIFSLSRLDKIKNLTSLVRWFGESKELQQVSNLIIVAGSVNAENSKDEEEKEQIGLMHSVINDYKLQNKIRWIGRLFRKDQTGEVYRLIADRRGIFVQPALFEGFGLTVLEAMHSGLPVFATKYGGPFEIIDDRINGFHIDPVNSEETIKKILDFVTKVKNDKSQWEKISVKAIKRVETDYNWDKYA
ncbi:MAG TPA: sucrose synthase, partial [Ignavibacteriaceae bacterium]